MGSSAKTAYKERPQKMRGVAWILDLSEKNALDFRGG